MMYRKLQGKPEFTVSGHIACFGVFVRLMVAEMAAPGEALCAHWCRGYNRL
jgi:hypothetical protein